MDVVAEGSPVRRAAGCAIGWPFSFSTVSAGATREFVGVRRPDAQVLPCLTGIPLLFRSDSSSIRSH
jgi:hypothetical protein